MERDQARLGEIWTNNRPYFCHNIEHLTQRSGRTETKHQDLIKAMGYSNTQVYRRQAVPLFFLVCLYNVRVRVRTCWN